MHTNQSRNGRLISTTTQDGHRPGYSSLVGGSAKVTMISYEEHIELWAEIAPYNELSRQFESEPMLDQRTLELIALIEGTDDPDIRQVAISDLFREKGIRY